MKGVAMTEAEKALAEGDYKRACELFNQVLDDVPLDVVALTGLGYSYHMCGEPERAIEMFERVLQLEPANAQIHHLLGGVYYWRKDYWNAAEHQRQAVVLAPTVAAYRISLGSDLMKLSEPEAALEQMEAAYRLDSRTLGPHGRCKLWVARVFTGLGPVSWLVFWAFVGAGLTRAGTTSLDQAAAWLPHNIPLLMSNLGQVLFRDAVVSIPFCATVLCQLAKRRYRRAIWALLLWGIWGVLVW